MTILEALTWGEQSIKTTSSHKTQGNHNAKLDAQVILSYCINKPSSFLFAHFNDELPKDIFENFQRLIARRTRHEPVAYLIGEKSFYKRRFFVTPDVLIPRPETEIIIDLTQKIIAPETLVLDVGTGSGAIAVTIASEFGNNVIASDIDNNALKIAKQNAEIHNVNSRITFMQGSLLEPFFNKNIRPSEPVIIIANLPYIPVHDWMELDPDVKDYEPKRALTGGVDGLEFYEELLIDLKNHTLLFEIDPSQELMLPNRIKHFFPNSKTEVIPDLQGFSRITKTKITP